MIALSPASLDSGDCCEVVSIVIDRGELAIRIVPDGLTDTILYGLDWDPHVKCYRRSVL